MGLRGALYWQQTQKKHKKQWGMGSVPHCTLHGCDGGLREADVALGDVEGRLMLGDLHAGAHVALAMEEEGEGA